MKKFKELTNEEIVRYIMEALEERCDGHVEITSACYSILDVLYELINYETYSEIANEVERQVAEKYEIMII